MIRHRCSVNNLSDSQVKDVVFFEEKSLKICLHPFFSGLLNFHFSSFCLNIYCNLEKSIWDLSLSLARCLSYSPEWSLSPTQFFYIIIIILDITFKSLSHENISLFVCDFFFKSGLYVIFTFEEDRSASLEEFVNSHSCFWWVELFQGGYAG